MSRAARVCPACAAKNHPTWRACQRCGTELGKEPAKAKNGKVAGGDNGIMGQSRWLFAAGAGTLVIAAAIAVPRLTHGTPAAGEATQARPKGAAAASVSARADSHGSPVVALAAGTPSDLVRQSSAAYDRGDFKAALELLQRAVAANPSDAVAQNNLGQVLVRLGQVPEAIQHLSAAAEAVPGNWSYRFNLARAQGLSGDWGSAVESYQQADALFPNDHVTLFNLAQALQKANRPADALPVLERVVAAAPDDPSFLLSLGSAYEQAGRGADAARAYARYLEQAPSAPDAAAVKARVARLPAPAASETSAPAPEPPAPAAAGTAADPPAPTPGPA
jgi:Flp pilus assembly protein TadD